MLWELHVGLRFPLSIFYVDEATPERVVVGVSLDSMDSQLHRPLNCLVNEILLFGLRWFTQIPCLLASQLFTSREGGLG